MPFFDNQTRSLGPQQTDKTTGDEWWKSSVIYQVYPRSFQDSNGDGIGDIKGIERRLDYLVSLGINAIWISPFFKSPMKDFGYDVENHRAIDPLFGHIEDFDSLIAQAHERGIRVLIDLVLSHTADNHPWFIESRSNKQNPHSDCYVWADPKENGDPPNNWLSIFGGSAWAYEPQRQQYYLHNFLESQPDLNFHCPMVRKEALDIARWWLDRGVDGFRLDTVNFYFHDRKLRDNPLASHPDNQVASADNPYSLQDHVYDKNRPQVVDFLSDLGALLAEYPGAIALGEVGATESRALDLMNEYQQPGRLQLCYTFDLLSSDFSAAHFRRILNRDEHGANTIWRCLAFSNHDVQRTATRFSKNHDNPTAIASMSMAILLSLRGTPCIYQGEELGLTESDIPYDRLVDPYGIAFWPTFKGRDGCRTPMPWEKAHPQAGFTEPDQIPWLPVDPAHYSCSVDVQQIQPDSLLLQTQTLVHLHRNHPAFHSEHISSLDGPPDLLIFERGNGESRVLCLFNLSDASLSYPVPTSYTTEGILAHGGHISENKELNQFDFKPWSWALVKTHYSAD
jgi:alpha-glucosidase